MRAMMPVLDSPRVMAGRTRCANVPRPATGKMGVSTAKKRMASSPNQKVGMLTPMRARIMESASTHEFGLRAEIIPKPMPITRAKMMAATASSTVLGKKSMSSCVTGRLVRVERPRSPCTTPVMKRWNCTGMESLRPKRSRMRSTVAASANSPASSRAGSPGAKRTIRKTMMRTPSKEGSATSRRRIVYWVKRSPLDSYSFQQDMSILYERFRREAGPPGPGGNRERVGGGDAASHPRPSLLEAGGVSQYALGRVDDQTVHVVAHGYQLRLAVQEEPGGVLPDERHGLFVGLEALLGVGVGAGEE